MLLVHIGIASLRQFQCAPTTYVNSINECVVAWLKDQQLPEHQTTTNTHWNQSGYLCTLPGRLAQLVTCLTTDASLTADLGVANSTPALSHTFVEIDREIISTVFLLPSAESFKKGCCQLQAKVCARSTG